MGFTDLLSRLPSRKALQTSHYDNKFLVATVKKIVDNLSVNIDCKIKLYKERIVQSSGCKYYY